METQLKPTTEFQCVFTIKYTDTVESPLKINDMALLKKFPLLMEAVDAENPNWRTTPDAKIVVSKPIPFPFDQASLAFILCNIMEYEHPNSLEGGGDAAEHYPEAVQHTADQLKQICEAAHYLKCETFMHCIAFVIGSTKLSNVAPEKIADFLELKKEGQKAEQ
ncbi:hypothetical protein CAEBREN_15048 [Caenorhabditis brenneri]|uniref:Uncharacterized protein n=1 Tax=Caenorhabditis brenneri TaxID=135651 RepID=G0MC00_CAEBE|nr:hypothetical protein CAEBREN_15048 [Caenorhabditis brenneri]